MSSASVPTKTRGMLVWSSKKYFIEALVCWTVGAVNCWKFNFHMLNYGGWLFITAYTVLVIVVGIPYTCLELFLGQYPSKGPIASRYFCPLLKGAGWVSLAALLVLQGYYSASYIYAFMFVLASFKARVPWSWCDPKWAGINCFTFEENTTIHFDCIDKYGEEFCKGLQWQNSALHFWEKKVSRVRKLEDGYGRIRTDMLLHSFGHAFALFVVNLKGTKSAEIVMSFLTFYPYVTLVVLLFTSLIIPGGLRGLIFFLTQSKTTVNYLEPSVMAFAVLISSLGVGLGGFVALGSQANFRNPIHIQAIFINILDYATSLLYTVLTETCRGVLSHHIAIPVEKVAKWPVPTIFSSLPLSFVYFPWKAQMWSFLFFSGMYIMGMRSQLMMQHTVLKAFSDLYPNMLKYPVACSAVSSLCIVAFSLPYAFEAGPLVLAIIEVSVTHHVLVLVNLCTLWGVIWIYGLAKFRDDMHFMLGIRPSLYWQISWFLCPLVVFVVLIAQYAGTLLFTFKDLYLSVIGGCFLAAAVLVIAMFAAVHIVTFGKKRFKCVQMLKPSHKWDPEDPVLRKSRRMFYAYSMTKEYVYRQDRLKNKTKQLEDLSDGSSSS